MALLYPDSEVLWVPPVDIKVKTCKDKNKSRVLVLFIPPFSHTIVIKLKT